MLQCLFAQSVPFLDYSVFVSAKLAYFFWQPRGEALVYLRGEPAKTSRDFYEKLVEVFAGGVVRLGKMILLELAVDLFERGGFNLKILSLLFGSTKCRNHSFVS